MSNAGITIAGPRVADVTDRYWQRPRDVDLTGVFNWVPAELEHILQAGMGSIVNTVSVLALVDVPG